MSISSQNDQGPLKKSKSNETRFLKFLRSETQENLGCFE